MKHLVRCLAVALATLWVAPVLAADPPTYLPGSRLGLVPLVGLAPAKTFVGFETEDQSVKVLITELPTASSRKPSKRAPAARSTPWKTLRTALRPYGATP